MVNDMEDKELKELETIINFSDIYIDLEDADEEDKVYATLMVEGEGLIGKKMDKEKLEECVERRKERMKRGIQ